MIRRRRYGAIAIAAAMLAWPATSAHVAHADPPASGGMRPDQMYMLNCWGCHRPNGEGIPGTAPPLKDAADFLRVPGGREYLISVPGVSSSALDNRQVADVMNWILKSFSKDRMPADFKPYTADEIAKARSTHMMDIKTARADLVTRMVALKIRAPEK